MYLLIKNEAILLFKEFLNDEMEFLEFEREISRLHQLGLDRYSTLNHDEANRLKILARTSRFENFYDDIFSVLETQQMGPVEIRYLISSNLSDFI